MKNQSKKKRRSFPVSVLIALLKSIRHWVRREISKQQVKILLKKKKNISLEIGSGRKKGSNGWVTLDLSTGCDIYWDLNEGLPFPDNSVRKLYSSHLFEHFTFQEAEMLFDECLRVLVRGGDLSICVPNAKLFIDAYYKTEEQMDQSELLAYKPAFNNISKLDYINYIAYMDGAHNYMFDEESLLKRLELKGFRNVHLRKFDPLLDLNEREFESIYAQGQK